MNTKATFFTVCGGGEDYEFLLGAIEHHAEMGTHIVLDTTPRERSKAFRRLPDSVFWIHEPFYGAGWKEFRLRSAVERCMKLARQLQGEILVYLDSDEFYATSSPRELFPHARGAMLEVQYVHWRRDGLPYVYGESEWHRRLWPRRSLVEIASNLAWRVHPQFNGNSEHHPVPSAPSDLPVYRVAGHFRHHLHYALGEKSKDEETALATIEGWDGPGTQVGLSPWPTKLARWQTHGIPPSTDFL